MRRREFIKNSALTIGAGTLLTASSSSEVKTDKGKVIRRKFDNTTMPLLALGCMRLPVKGKEVDMAELEKMVQYAMDCGMNYFDTAYMYVDGKSENAIGEVLKKYPRESFILTDKSPAYLINSKEDVLRIFNEQLKKCQVEYFDNYMVHNINKNSISNYRDNDMYGELLKLKKEGKIKHLGFSFHGDPKMLREVISEHKWDFCQLQLNYLDWEVVNAKELYEIADEANVPVIVMEPLRGSALCNLPQKAEEKLKEVCPNDTPASFALRWIASKKRVFTILSGMSSLEQVKQNAQVFINYKKLRKKKKKLASEIVKIIQSQGAIGCTACKYCMEVCPKGINIAAIFALYNMFKSSTQANRNFMFVYNYNALEESTRADKCIECGLCSRNCPQGLDIPKLLKEVQKEVENVEKKMA